MKTIILAISDSDKHFQTAIQEYQKRLGKKVECIMLKPAVGSSPDEMKQRDTKHIQEILEKKYSDFDKILLGKDECRDEACLVRDVHGQRTIKSITTDWFVGQVKKHTDMIFIIGWPYGLIEENLSSIDAKISFGSITMPHGLAKLVLLEQLYRADMIVQGRSYHY